MKSSIHGNLVVIDQLGVLITGERDIGKSELSLALIDRGHQLVCDDVVDIEKKADKIIGRCPELINNYLLINGIGMIDVAKLFGAKSVLSSHEIHLNIELRKAAHLPALQDPLKPMTESFSLEGVTLPKFLFPTIENKGLPLLIEILVRNHRLALDGYNVSDVFNQRYQQEQQHDSKKNNHR